MTGRRGRPGCEEGSEDDGGEDGATPGHAMISRSTLRMQHPTLDDGADAAAEVEHRGAGAAQAGDLVGVVGGAGDRAPGGAVGELLDDQPPQRRRQLGKAAELDRVAG